MCSVLDLPIELILQIIALLDVSEVLSLRKTCRILAESTRMKAVWLNQLRHQRFDLLLPFNVRDLESSTKLPTLDIERLVVSAHLSQKDWPFPSSKSLSFVGISQGYHNILALVPLDQRLLCIYGDGAVVLWEFAQADWNNLEERIIPQRACWNLGSEGPWTTAVARLDVFTNSIYAAVTRDQDGPHLTATVVMKIHLNEPSFAVPSSSMDLHVSEGAQFDKVDTLFSIYGQFLRAIDSSRQLLAFSRGNCIDIVHWSSNSGMTINISLDGSEYMYDGIIGMQFMGSYLLCVRARAIEVYSLEVPFPPHLSYFVISARAPVPLPTCPQANYFAHQVQPVARYKFSLSSHAAYKDVSFSYPNFGRSSSASFAPITISFLTHDALRGVYLYNLTLIPSADLSSQRAAPPLLHVKLAGMYNVSRNSPGFINALALGPQGRRGVWIERLMDVPTRRVLVFSVPGETDLTDLGHHSAPGFVSESPEDGAGLDHSETDSMDDQSLDEPLSEDSEDELQNGYSLHAPLIEAHTVYESTTYYLREDLLSLGLAEVSGRIALGTRFGQIQMI